MIVPRGRQLFKMLTYVGRPLLMLVLYDLAVVVAYKVLHWGVGGPATYSADVVRVGDWNYCGVSESVVVCAMVGGTNAVGRSGEQLAELGATSDDGDDAIE